MQLKYGCNPHQAFAAADPIERAPLKLLNGQPSLINLLDALNGWQLVRELRQALGLAAAASFKHVSPAGAALAIPLSTELAELYEVSGVELSPAALAYVRARGADPKCSFGDFVALSEPVDEVTASYLKTVVSDGIIAPGYHPNALATLAAKKGGSFIVLEVDAAFEPPAREAREVFGVRLTQDRNAHVFSERDLVDVVSGELTDEARRDLVLGYTTLKYTQSNSVGYAVGGQMIGIGAGQQSRVDCTKLAGAKADVWQLGRHPMVLGLRFKPEVKKQDRINWRVRYIEGDLTRYEERALAEALTTPSRPLGESEKRAFLSQVSGVSMVSDGFIPFRDNIDHAQRHGVMFIAQPGGSSRDQDIERACREYGITMVHTHIRAFHH
jgi:phosphoribosylaminoimidazolecarboxamide formyltransferase/IMP cyclohydrolase